MRFLTSLTVALSWAFVHATTITHDESFVPDAVLRVSEKVLSQSCLPARSTVVINGTTPGPELRLKEGVTYWIRVYNDMAAQNLTMHWHGLSQAAAAFSDGTPLASQWPIPALHFFDYEIRVPLGMAGTYFYHSHVGFQAVTAGGPLIITEKHETPYKYDGEKIIFIQDAFVKNDSTIEQGLIATPLSWSGEAQAILVNGKGGGSANGTVCNASLGTINVEYGKTYRLRFVGATALTFASLAIEGHNLTVIEADGSYTDPHETSYLQIGAGQRYSVLLHTKTAPTDGKSQYYMQLESRERPTLTRSFAVLNYGAKSNTIYYPPPTLPLTLPNTTHDFLDYTLRPLSNSSLPSHVQHHDRLPTAKEVTRRVTLTVHQSVRGPTVWLQNGYPWTEQFPTEPYLVSLYTDESNFPNMTRALANNGLDPVTRSFPAKLGEVLEIVIQNTGADSGGLDAHPFHAHGEHFWDLGSGNGTYNASANDAKWAGLAPYASPIKRDTSVLYRYNRATGNGTVQGWRAWRLKVTEPGVWMVHCHILQHMGMGMQTVWVMGNKEDVLKKNKADVQGYLTYGGDVVGNENRWPSVVSYWNGWEDGQ